MGAHKRRYGRMPGLLIPLLLALTPAARADIAVVVNPQNLLAQLSEEDVRRIFLGREHLFPDSDTSMEVADQDEEQQVFGAFYQAIAHLTPAKLKRQRAGYLFSGKGRLPTTLKDDAAVHDFVAGHPAGIGYLTAEHADGAVKIVWVLKQ